MANGNGNGSKNSAEGGGGTSAVVKEGPKATVPAATVPSTGAAPVLATGGLLALGGAAIYGLHRWRQSRVLAESKGAPLPSGGGGAPGQGVPQGGTQAGPQGGVPAAAGPAVVDPTFWGTSDQGAEFRPVLQKIEEVSRMPVRLFLLVVGNRESGWNRRARNKSKDIRLS